MPIYAYKCSACGHAQDKLQKMSDAALTVCPACGAAAYQKQVTAAGFQLKGSGWYVTDFRDGGGKKADGAGKADEAAGKPADTAGTAGKPADAGSTDKPAAAPAPAASPAPAPAPAAAPTSSSSSSTS